jgi:hypothetical protein
MLGAYYLFHVQPDGGNPKLTMHPPHGHLPSRPFIRPAFLSDPLPFSVGELEEYFVILLES